MTIIKNLFIFLLLTNACLGLAKANDHNNLLVKLKVPKGFKLSVFADNLPNARSMTLGDNGVVYIGTGASGVVYAVEDSDHDGLVDKKHIIAKDLYMPNGVAYRDGSLYVAEINRIIRFDHITENLVKPPSPAVVYDKLPLNQHHGWKYLRVGPDGKLYSAIGAPCNICKPEPPYGTLFRIDPDGSHFEIIAEGIRNSVGFDWQPETNALFFNDNGRDYLGDDSPPEELNRWSKPGEHFGYPFCHAGLIVDPELGKGKNCKDYASPVWQYNAHNAPLGMRFYRGKQFPSAYKNQLFVALHGSWNRAKPDGYKVVMVKFEQGKPIAEEAFVSGWLSNDDTVLGRPVDILELPDSSLLISDDQNGLIYQVKYQGK